MKTFQHLFSKLYYIPVIIIWATILVKYRRLLGFTPKLLKGERGSGKAIWFPLLAIMAMLLTLALVLPFSYDEAFTFTQFTYPGLQQAVCNYPAPNNHVFHSILTCITWFIFQFTHSELAVRLPALFFSAFTLYFVFTKYLEGNVYAMALFGILYLFCPNIIELAFQARGYSIQICCAVVAYFFAVNNSTSGNIPFLQKLNIVLLTSAMGLFTSPAYLYTASCVYLIFATVNYREIKKAFFPFIVINIFYGLTVLLLYSPIIVTKGLHQLTANPFVTPVDGFSVTQQVTYLKGLVNFLTLPYGMGWLIAALFIWNTLQRRWYYNVYILLVPFVLMYLLKQLPFNRVFLPIGGLVLVNACMAITGNNYFKKITAATLSLTHRLTAFVLVAASSVLSYIYFNDYHKKDDLAKAYHFKKIRPAISGHNKVYTKNIGSDWDMAEILSAYTKLHGMDDPKEIDAELKDDFKSAIIVSTERVGNFAVVDSTAAFDGQPVLVIDPNK